MVSPLSLNIPQGMSGKMTVTATVPASATPGASVLGSLALFTNDPSSPNRILPLAVTPSGATLTGNSEYAFASSEITVPAPPVAVQITNSGNAPAIFSVGAPSDPSVSLMQPPLADGGFMLAPGDTWNATATFTPSKASSVTSNVTVSTSGTTCGTNLSTISFVGSGASGSISGWPSDNKIDFGPVNCGGAPAPPYVVQLQNSSHSTPASVVTATLTGGFTTDVKMGTGIPAAGSLNITFKAPPVPQTSSLTPITGTLTFQTDADPAPLTITLSEEPQGAVLGFGDPANGCAQFGASSKFGQFSNVILLQSAPPQNFCVTNSGNAPANVTVTATENGDAGADAGADAGLDATTADAGADPFGVSTPAFTLTAGPPPTQQQETLAFTPLHANGTVGSLAMAVDPQTVLCAPLPQPIHLSGTASGGSLYLSQTTLNFYATCGGSAPPDQTFTFANNGSLNLTWAMSLTGPGASNYQVMMSQMPGTLIPNQSVSVQVSALGVASPAPNANSGALAAQLTFTTDIPYDPPHVLTLNTVPIGDQLSVSVGSLRFGQIPLNQSITQSFTVTNNANPGPGSGDAKFSFSVIPGFDSGVSPYQAPAAADIPAGGTQTQTVTFNATTAGSYPATLAFVTSDGLCAPLPTPITLSGTGVNGQLALSAKTLTFGTDPKDTNGYVNCGATGLPQTLTLTNIGNQPLSITTLDLDGGANSPFSLPATGATPPINLTLGGGSTTITITPKPIPQSLADAGEITDMSAFSDTLNVMTSAAGDTGQQVALVMQPRGAIIVDSQPPLRTTWDFGSVSFGSIGTITSAITNIGNAKATVSLSGLAQPTIFGLANNPTTVAPGGVTSIVGQFTPPSADGSWVDQGTLTVATDTAFCQGTTTQPLPTQWTTPMINVSGSSNSNPPVTLSGTLAFPTTDCGSASPAPESITLTSHANVDYPLTLTFSSGKYYTTNLVSDSGSTLPAMGVVTLVVTPKSVPPGPNVFPGTAPYADNLLIQVGSPSIISFSVPISWGLNGAVLSLPNGNGPYKADSTSGYTLPMSNTGTGAANVDFSIMPSGLFSFTPAPPVQVLPGILASPQFVTPSSGTPACPTTTPGTASFTYSGPVCQPFPVANVSVKACSGTQ
jgi:hypothetical protein